MNDEIELAGYLSYNSETGVLFWAKAICSRFKAGHEAGYIRSDGYRYVRFNNKVYLAHRLCWAIHTGEFPTLSIDHVNMDKADNRISNLRIATAAENNRNREKQSNNTSGYKGISLHKGTGKFCARISRDKIRTLLGYFETAELAAEAYRLAAKEKHNEFARY